jgi:cell division protein FtsL
LKKKAPAYRLFGNILVSALTGNANVGTTLLVYLAIAMLLLGYVSAQVLTGALTQDIADIKQARSSQKEKLNRLTSDYVSLSSRARVSNYCENVLGMVHANNGSLRRFAVDDVDWRFSAPVEFTEKGSAGLDPLRFTLQDENGKSEL